MSEEIQVLTKWELESNPSVIGDNLVKLASDIEAAKDNISELKERNLWQRLTNNNTRDFAEVMLKQNDTMSAFMVIVQGIIFLSMNNVVVLGGIMDAINKAEDTNDLRDNKYITLAKDYLSEAIKAARKGEANEKEIENIKAKLVAAYKNQENQAALLKEIETKLDQKEHTDEQQDAVIENLKARLDKQEQIANQQSEIITEMKAEINQSQNLHEQWRKGLVIAYIIGGIGLIASVITLVFVLK